MIKICKICNTQITNPKSNNQIYCSRKCKNRGYYLQKKEQRRRNRVKWYNNVVCAWCGASSIEYHHVDPKSRKYLVSGLMTCSDKTIQDEVNKCIPLCKPCHLKAHVEINNRTEHFCEICGKQIIIKGHTINQYCSDACRTVLYRRRHPEKIRAAKKKYREENREKVAITKKKYRLENKEKITLYSKQYRLKNKEKIDKRNKENRRRKRLEHPDFNW